MPLRRAEVEEGVRRALARDDETGLPVYVFVHGGGNTMSYATQLPDYLGNRQAARSRMVFVSFTHRKSWRGVLD